MAAEDGLDLTGEQVAALVKAGNTRGACDADDGNSKIIPIPKLHRTGYGVENEATKQWAV